MILPSSLDNTDLKRSEQFEQDNSTLDDTGLKRSEKFKTNNRNDQQSVKMILPSSLDNTGLKGSEQFEQDNPILDNTGLKRSEQFEQDFPTLDDTGLKRSEQFETKDCNDQQSVEMMLPLSIDSTGPKRSKKFNQDFPTSALAKKRKIKVWPNNPIMLQMIKSILDSKSTCPDAPEFCFKITLEAAETNFKVLKRHDFDL